MKKTDETYGLGFKKPVFGAVGASAMVFFGAFMVAFLASSNFAPAFDSSAAEINVTNEATGYYADISTLGTVDIQLEATPDGTAKVGKDTVTVDTNAKTGYKLYISTISGADGNGLYLEDDNTKSIAASAGTVTTPVALATNTWGYIPSRSNSSQTATEYTDADVASGGSATVIGVPEYGSEDILYMNDSPTTASTNTLDVYYGVNVSTAMPSGNYSNTIVYTAIVDAVNDDSAEISIAPASQAGLAAGNPVTISTGLYPGFPVSDLGEITVTIGGNVCTGITPSITSAGNLNITCAAPAAAAAGKYDVVVNVAKYGKTYTMTEGYEYTGEYMQDFSAAEHESDVTGTEYANLIDSRDGKIYSAKKLADGNVWMMKNLELDLPSGQTSRTLTPEDSDVSADWTLTDNSNGTPGWCNQDTDACDNQKLISRTGYTDGENTAPTYYYNWYTATAGTGTSAVASGDVSDSICPKGWKLPTTTQFSNLDKAYGGSGSNRTDVNQITNFTQNVGFGFTGRRSAASVDYPNSQAYYWSRSASRAEFAYSLSFSSGTGGGGFDPSAGNFSPQSSNVKWNGFAVRCVATTSMQDFSATEHAADAVGTEYKLTDIRDDNKYTAKKLADGNIWMTQNLRLVGSKTLTPADSNVTTNFTLTASDYGTWCQEDNSACDDQSMVLDSGNTSYGTYYNWYAATAGTGKYETSSGNATVSICPKGWHLPTSAEFNTLYSNYNSSGAMLDTNGPAFVLSGRRDGSSTYNQGSYGYYWSSTASSSSSAYNLYLGSSNVNPQSNNGKYCGFTVRCVASS